jgi:hypothetical protein
MGAEAVVVIVVAAAGQLRSSPNLATRPMGGLAHFFYEDSYRIILAWFRM